jgi:hypothetical protein
VLRGQEPHAELECLLKCSSDGENRSWNTRSTFTLCIITHDSCMTSRTFERVHRIMFQCTVYSYTVLYHGSETRNILNDSAKSTHVRNTCTYVCSLASVNE